MIITVWNGINLHTIHSVVYKEVRKIFEELNIYTFGYILLQLNDRILTNLSLTYSIIKKEIYL